MRGPRAIQHPAACRRPGSRMRWRRRRRSRGPCIHAQGLALGVRVIFNPSPGAWAERLKIPADLVTPIPDDLPDAIAAQLLPNDRPHRTARSSPDLVRKLGHRARRRGTG